MKRTIKNPHWTNNARTMLSAEFHYDDGRVIVASISDTDKGNPDYIEIMEKFSREELEKNTLEKIKKISQEREIERQREIAKQERAKQEALFSAKLKSFEIDVVKNSSKREYKSKIRRAKSDLEVIAYTAALLIEEMNNPSPVQEETQQQE